ncbi:hypothetical protein Salat_0226100 [Sesamum alatum]|uniref:Myb/SANT-like domain-containing protein n=1 Tax=Sesamum alatum TaxID=300844 RepID=A0AAE1YY81_9LAMI|nr:hypothetical protein Salat_0226100 [Sesamum alatum]
MEQTFVDSLVEHARSGLFHPDRPNIHAVMCSLYDVNKKYGTKVVYEWAQTRVERLRERYHLFRWVVNMEGVIWNARLGFVTAPDHVWQSLCRQNKRAKCYYNAYEDLWEQLCIIFDPRPNNQNDVIDVDRFDLHVVAPQEGWVLLPPPRLIQATVGAPNPEAVPIVVPNEAGATEPAPDGPNNEPVLDALHTAQALDAPEAEPAPDQCGFYSSPTRCATVEESKGCTSFPNEPKIRRVFKLNSIEYTPTKETRVNGETGVAGGSCVGVPGDFFWAIGSSSLGNSIRVNPGFARTGTFYTLYALYVFTLATIRLPRFCVIRISIGTHRRIAFSPKLMIGSVSGSVGTSPTVKKPRFGLIDDLGPTVGVGEEKADFQFLGYKPYKGKKPVVVNLDLDGMDTD